MKDSKIVRLLSSLNSKELKRLEIYLTSGMIKPAKEEETIPLFKLLKKHHPNFTEKNINKHLIYNTLYNKELTLKDKLPRKMDDIMSKLSNHVEDFMAILELEKSTYEKRELTLKALNKRGLAKDFFQKSDRELKISSITKPNFRKETDFPWGDISYYAHIIKVFDAYYLHPNTSIKKGKLMIDEVNYYAKINYYATILKYGCEILIRQRFLNEQYDNTELFRIIDIVKEQELDKQHPLLKLYLLIIFLCQKVDDEKYEELKLLLFKINKNQKELKRFVTEILTNYLTPLLRTGNVKYATDSFIIYKLGFDEKLFINNGYIYPIHYHNAVHIGSRLRIDDEWIQNFIVSYKKYLKKDIREDAFMFANVVLNFNQGKYEQTLDIWQNTQFQHIQYKLNIRCYAIMSYFELDQESLCHYTCNNFEKFLQRNKSLSDNKIAINKRFITFVRKLQKAKYSNRLSKDTLTNELAAINNISFRQWLTQKISSLK